MTWWEAEEMATYVSEVEAALDEWALSNPQMRHEQLTVDRIAKKITHNLSQTTAPDKKNFLAHLVNRIEGLRKHLTERLKRDIPSRQSGSG